MPLLIYAGGYTTDVTVYDVATGKLKRTLRGVAKDHINITKFANHLPDIILT
jgi:hypothetical protein